MRIYSSHTLKYFEHQESHIIHYSEVRKLVETRIENEDATEPDLPTSLFGLIKDIISTYKMLRKKLSGMKTRELIAFILRLLVKIVLEIKRDS